MVRSKLGAVRTSLHGTRTSAPGSRLPEHTWLHATTGAAAISGKPLQRIEVHGKNLFYFWGDDALLATADLSGPQPPEGLPDAVILHGEG